MPDKQSRQGVGVGISPAWLAAGIAAGLAATLGPAAMAYASTHPTRRRPRRLPAGFPNGEEIAFPTSDGLTLSGWFLPSAEARAGIILCHGFPNDRSEMLWWAEMLRPIGAHLMLFDFRAMGRSEGSLSSIGWHEADDVAAAAEYMAGRSEMRRLPVGVFGLSMGGAAAILAAARDDRIRFVATHGAYARLDRAIEQRSRLLLGPLARPASKASIRWLNRWLPEDPGRIAPVDVISRIAPRPLLIMHGARDRIVSPEDSRLLYAAAGEPKELVRLPHSWHARVHRVDQPRCRQALLRFYQRAIA